MTVTPVRETAYRLASIARGLSTASAVVLLLAVALAVGIYPLMARPDVVQGEAFLFSDEGMTLLLGSVLHAGGRLYLDIYTPYAPLSVWMWQAFASVAGNTPMAFGALQAGLNTAVLLLVFATLRRFMAPAWALAFTVICVLPAVMIRGQILGGYWAGTYIGVERLLLALLLFCWRPPLERTLTRSLALGVMLGAFQWVKFGSVVFFAGGFLAAEALAISGARDRRAAVRHTMIALAVVIAAEGAQVLWAVSTLPWAVARDVVWPSFGVRMYETIPTAVRFPPFASHVYLFRRDAAIVAGAGLGAMFVWKHRQSPAAPVVAFLLVSYLMGATLLFRHVYHFYQYAWIPAAAAGFAMAAASVRARMVVLLWCLPVLAISLKGMLAVPRPGEWVQTPAAGALYLSRAAAEDLRALNALEAEVASKGGWRARFQTPGR